MGCLGDWTLALFGFRTSLPISVGALSNPVHATPFSIPYNTPLPQFSRGLSLWGKTYRFNLSPPLLFHFLTLLIYAKTETFIFLCRSPVHASGILR